LNRPPGKIPFFRFFLSFDIFSPAYYASKGKKKERTARFIERMGIEELKRAVL
jgi:hypothetical protein